MNLLFITLKKYNDKIIIIVIVLIEIKLSLHTKCT